MLSNILKKLLLTNFVLCAIPGIALAKGTPYVGAALGIQNTGGGYTGLFANISGGYSAILGIDKKFYIAGEVFADTGTLPLSQNYYRRTNYGIGASVLPGLILAQDTLLYTRIGIESFSYSQQQNMFTGGQLGIGLQTKITDQWDIRGEYVYTGEGVFENFGESRFALFRLGLVYKFK